MQIPCAYCKIAGHHIRDCAERKSVEERKRQSTSSQNWQTVRKQPKYVAPTPLRKVETVKNQFANLYSSSEDELEEGEIAEDRPYCESSSSRFAGEISLAHRRESLKSNDRITRKSPIKPVSEPEKESTSKETTTEEPTAKETTAKETTAKESTAKETTEEEPTAKESTEEKKSDGELKPKEEVTEGEDTFGPSMQNKPHNKNAYWVVKIPFVEDTSVWKKNKWEISEIKFRQKLIDDRVDKTLGKVKKGVWFNVGERYIKLSSLEEKDESLSENLKGSYENKYKLNSGVVDRRKI